MLTPIAITKTADLNFGSFAVSASTAGTVIVDAADGRTFGGAGGASAVSTATGFVSASFDLSGVATATFSITLPTAPVTVTHTTVPANTMSVSAFVSNPATTGVLDASGLRTVKVGATLTVPAGQAAGTYTHATGLPVTVAYN